MPTKIISIRNGYPGYTHISDLNQDCLTHLFGYLDMASQFAILQTHPKFVDVVLLNLWHRYNMISFDVSRYPTKFARSMKFLSEFLETILSRFPIVTRIPSDLFKYTMQLSKYPTFDNVSDLRIENLTGSDTIAIDLQEFSRFPNLQSLKLDNVLVHFGKSKILETLTTFEFVSSCIIDDREDEFMNQIFQCKLYGLDFRPSLKYAVAPVFNLQPITKCSHLRELTLYCHHLRDNKMLDCVLHLPALESLTLYSQCNFYFTTEEQQTFIAIISNDHRKPMAALEMFGIPNRWFFQQPNLKNVAAFSWAVDRIFHKKADGSVEWDSQLHSTVQAFYKFVLGSQSLRTLQLHNNIVLSKMILEYRHFEETLQTSRQKKGYSNIEFLKSVNRREKGIQDDCNSEGFVRFTQQRQGAYKIRKMPRDEPSFNRNPAACNPDPSRTPRRLFTDPYQRSLRSQNDCTRNYTPNDRRCPTPKSKGRSLNLAMEMERDKQIACERYRSSSTDGRIYAADLDISNNNCYPNGVCYAPPNLKGRSLNVAAEVQRDIRLALARSRAGPDRRMSPQPRNNLSQGTSQFDNVLSDSGTENVPTNKSYNFVTSTQRIDRSNSDSPAPPNSQIPQFTGIPQYDATESTSARTTSREGSPTHATSPSSRQKQEYGASDTYPGPGKTITRTVVTTKTTRTIPPQNSRHLPSNSFYEDQGQQNTSLDVATARYKDQSPAVGIWRQPTFNNSQPLSISSFASNAASQAEKASHNTMQCPKEVFDAQHDPFASINATFGMPAAESTRYETTDERQYSPDSNDGIGRTSLQQRYNETTTTQREPECPSIAYVGRGNVERLGATQIDEYYAEEHVPPYECPRPNIKQPDGCPRAMGYANFQSNTQSAAAKLNLTKPNVNVCTRDEYSQKPSGPSNVTTQGSYFASPEATRQQCELESFRRSSYPIPQHLQQCIPDSANASGQTRFCMSQYNNNELSRRQLCDRSQRSEVSRSVLECVEAKRCGRVQFDESDNYEIQSIQQTQMRKNQMETLVTDTYCPGIIQETLDGKKDFNSISFKLSFGTNLFTLYDNECNSIPSHDPMSLLEAFSLRIDKDRSEISKDLPEEAQETLIKETVNKHFDHKNPSDLNRCIKSLLLSEHIIDTISIVKAKTLSFTADVHRNVTTCPSFDAPAKLIVYTGLTKPAKIPE